MLLADARLRLDVLLSGILHDHLLEAGAGHARFHLVTAQRSGAIPSNVQFQAGRCVWGRDFCKNCLQKCNAMHLLSADSSSWSSFVFFSSSSIRESGLTRVPSTRPETVGPVSSMPFFRRSAAAFMRSSEPVSLIEPELWFLRAGARNTDIMSKCVIELAVGVCRSDTISGSFGATGWLVGFGLGGGENAGWWVGTQLRCNKRTDTNTRKQHTQTH